MHPSLLSTILAYKAYVCFVAYSKVYCIPVCHNKRRPLYFQTDSSWTNVGTFCSLKLVNSLSYRCQAVNQLQTVAAAKLKAVFLP